MPTPTKKLDAMLQAEPDLVDRIFEYILSDPVLAKAIQTQTSDGLEALSKLKTSVRQEFVGEKCYITHRSPTERQERVKQVLALFNGRNATEVARRLKISRATVYRYLIQPGKTN